MLLQCVGNGMDIEIQTIENRYEIGDVFLLCTDGQYNQLERGEIEDILEEVQEASEGEMDAITLDLIEAVKMRGERDNITSIVLRIE